MKKLMIAAFAIAFAAVAQAAAVDWNVTGTTANIGTTVYILTSIAQNYESVAAFEANAIGTATVVKINARTVGTGDQKASIDSTTDNVYLAVITAENTISYVVASTSGYVYNPDAQETSPGQIQNTLAGITSSPLTSTIGGGGEAIPEPTSALMLLVGLAGLALKRKVA